MNDINDINLLLKKIIEKGDETAFKILFHQFFPSLCIFAHRYIENWESCEDIVQDAFLKIWGDKKKIKITTSARNFLLTTVRNLCIDYLRHQELEQNWIQKRLILDSEELDGDIYSINELNTLINNALKKLPEPIFTSFSLSRFESKTYSEIAEIQQISQRKVESNISKALKFLRIELKDYLPFIIFLINLN